MTTPHRYRDAARPGSPGDTDRGAIGVLVPALIALIVLLLVAAVSMALLARRALADQDAELTALKTQQQSDQRTADSREQVEPPAPDLEVMQGELNAVRVADRAVDTTSTTWRQGGSQLKIVWESVGRCMALVDDYNRKAGRYTAAELAGLPVAVDVTAAATDCGAATLAKNAKGAGFS
jgi:hypothetical protein